jgi:hypothetical protein
MEIYENLSNVNFIFIYQKKLDEISQCKILSYYPYMFIGKKYFTAEYFAIGCEKKKMNNVNMIVGSY